jgi:hypothetical protein
VSSEPITAGVEEVANPEMVAFALRRITAGLRTHIEPSRFPGATLLVPLGPGGRPVVTESFRTVPVFSDLEALQAWASPPLGFAPDPALEPVVAGVGTLVLPDGIDELLAQGAWVVVFNPAGPGSSHLAGMVGETPLRPQDVADPPVERGFLGRAKGVVGANDPRVRVAERKQLRDKVTRLLSQGVAARDAGDIAKSLKILKEADNEARQVGATVSSSTAAVHAARLLVQQGEASEGTGLADLAAMGSNRHATPRLQLEGLLICAENLERGVQQGRNIAAGTAVWTADWLRRLADVAVEQRSMPASRREELYRQADTIAATYNNPRNNYDPDAWTPDGWARANGPV